MTDKNAAETPEITMYKQHLRRSPYDAGTWFNLIHATKHTRDPILISDAFSSALKQYSNSGHLLSLFVEWELSRDNKEMAETIFNNNLFNVPSVELWKCYLNYVIRANTSEKSTVNECYQLLLQQVGIDREAGQIWLDYIEFLDDPKQIREAYQTAVTIPHLKVEEVWKNYDEFENKLDRTAARQLLSRLSPQYMAARSALREMNKHWDAIRRSQPPHGLPMEPGWSNREVEYLEAWRKYLEWEKSNPLNLGDQEMLRRRVVYAFNQASMALRLYPEIWIEFAEYLNANGQSDGALEKLTQASQALPQSLAVQFAYAEMAERQNQPEKAKQIYEQVVEQSKASIDLTTAKLNRKLAKLDKVLSAATGKKTKMDVDTKGDMSDTMSDGLVSESDSEASQLSSDASSDDGNDDDGDDDDDKDDNKRVEKIQRRVERSSARIKESMEDELETKRETYTLAWVMYLRYTQRSEGIDAFRQLLRRPRSDPPGYTTYHLFVAAALMEYHVAKRPDIASKLFEFYSKTYSGHPEYMTEYLNFLVSSGNATNARALFEKFHTGEPSEVWTMFSDYEYNYGNMAAIEKMDKRMVDKFGHESRLTRLAARYSYLNMNSVATSEFGFPYRSALFESKQQGEEERFREPEYGYRNELANVEIASISGRGLGRSQLLAPVASKRFTKPRVKDLEEYNPIVEAFNPLENRLDTPGSGGHQEARFSEMRISPTGPPQTSQQLLERGDILSYVAMSVAGMDDMGSMSLNTDLLVDAIVELPDIFQMAPSNYRPLMYQHNEDRSSRRGRKRRLVEQGNRSRSRDYRGGRYGRSGARREVDIKGSSYRPSGRR